MGVWVPELLSLPGVLIGVVGGVACPCSASACPVVMLLMCDLIVGVQALHECARIALGWVKWGGAFLGYWALFVFGCLV